MAGIQDGLSLMFAGSGTKRRRLTPAERIAYADIAVDVGLAKEKR